jgi:steroid delta-isomerase-like uncharacterized protein
VTRDLNLHVFTAWIEAHKRHDLERMLSCVTDNVKIESATAGTISGLYQAGEHWQQVFLAFPDLRMEPATITADEHRVVAEVDIEGTNSGSLGKTPATEKKISLRGAIVVEFDDGKISEFRTYYDEAEIGRQLGLKKSLLLG